MQYTTLPADELRENIAVALSWDAPSRWAVGDMLRELRRRGGDEAVLDAMPAENPKAARLAARCLAVADRWPDEAARFADLEWAHHDRVRWLDDGGATTALTAAADNGWTPRQLGRWLAGLDPNEPAVAEMARRLAETYRGGVVLLSWPDGWTCTGGGEAHQPSIGAAIRAAWRAQFGASGKGEG